MNPEEKITFKNMSLVLIKEFPELEPEYRKQEKEWNRPKPPFKDEIEAKKEKEFEETIRKMGMDPNSSWEETPGIVYGILLTNYIGKLTKSSGNDKKLKQIFDFLEKLVLSAKESRGIEVVL